MDLVFLHGRAAAGKLTIARALEQLVAYPVFHNHLVVDMLTPMFQFGSEVFVRLREQFWLAVFAEAARTGRSIIFTFAPEPTVPDGFPERARRVTSAAGGTVRFVRLTVSDAEQERRITDPSRLEFAKLTDLATLRRISAEPAVDEPPAEVEIDTDECTPAESAAHIVRRLQLAPEPRIPRYPESAPGQ